MKNITLTYVCFWAVRATCNLKSYLLLRFSSSEVEKIVFLGSLSNYEHHRYKQENHFHIHILTLFVSLNLIKTCLSSRSPNPIYLGTLVAGILHSLLCFYGKMIPNILKLRGMECLSVCFCKVNPISFKIYINITYLSFSDSLHLQQAFCLHFIDTLISYTFW